MSYKCEKCGESVNILYAKQCYDCFNKVVQCITGEFPCIDPLTKNLYSEIINTTICNSDVGMDDKGKLDLMKQIADKIRNL